MKAWERERQITDNAVPKLLSEEEQTWEAQFEVGAAEDFHLKLLWRSNVPGSNAPESIMLAAIQAKENLGYIVDMYEQGIDALNQDDMVRLNSVTTELWHAVNHARKDESAPSWRYKQYHDWESFRADARFPARKPVAREGLAERMYAGWMGQIVGGAIGTMVEGYTTDRIRETFGEVRGYLREPSTYNDDITYELAFLYTYEEKGKAITAADVAKAWIGYVPSGWSAEEMSIRNIRWGILPPDSGRVDNPFGEWIGAQILTAVATIVGIDGIHSEWKEPIGDELKTYLRKYRTLSIRALAKQTADATDV